MSMITTGTTELGCIITDGDMDYFVKRYIRLNPKEISETINGFDPDSSNNQEKAKDLVYEWLDTNEAFAYSCDSDRADGRTFIARMMRDDPYYPHMYILPIAEKMEYRGVNPDLIFVPADKGCYAKNIFRGGFYKDKEELIKEMKDKLSGYLPESFDWEANIGDLDYAIFG